MGKIFSKFKSTESQKEILEKIQIQIEEIENYKSISLRNRSHIIWLYVFFLVFFYGSFLVFLNFFYSKKIENQKVISLFLFGITLPFLIKLLINYLKSYHQHVLAIKDDKLFELKREKQKILNNIMENETYKVAKELIERYEPSMLKNKNLENNYSAYPPGLRQRLSFNTSLNLDKPTPIYLNTSKINQNIVTPYPLHNMQVPVTPKPIAPSNSPNSTFMQTPCRFPALPEPPKLIRPISAQDRSILEKFVDYLVGDGPNNRYALICKFCHSHNGMALKEEFEFLSFRCCYCRNFNNSRKLKPMAPLLSSFENLNELSMVQKDDNKSRETSPSRESSCNEEDNQTKTSESFIQNPDSQVNQEIKNSTVQKITESNQFLNDTQQSNIEKEVDLLEEKLDNLKMEF